MAEIEIKAQYSGEFTALKAVPEPIIAGEVIGRIYDGGIPNEQTSYAGGTITYILENGLQARQNETVVCRVDDGSAVPEAMT